MVTFEEAKKLALDRHAGFNRYQELRDAYIFWEDTEDESIGGLGEAVVLKSNGDVVNRLAYKFQTKEPFEILEQGML